MADTAPRTEFLTVKELAALLRIKERKVYDLASSGQVPCSRATGKLLFPEAEIRAWIARNKSGPAGTTRRAAVFLGSHDPLLDWALRESQAGFATMFDSSLDGLTRFVGGEGAAAGLHIHDGASGWNTKAVAAAALDAALIHWATRRRGLVLRKDLAGKVSSLDHLSGLRIARRQAQAGADVLFLHLLAKSGVDAETLTFTAPYRSEQDVVQAVAQDDADVAFGLEAVAAPYGLGFAPLIDERFDILVDRRAWFDPPMQTLMDFTRTETFRARTGKLTGYDMSGFGKVIWNA